MQICRRADICASARIEDEPHPLRMDFLFRTRGAALQHNDEFVLDQASGIEQPTAIRCTGEEKLTTADAVYSRRWPILVQLGPSRKAGRSREGAGAVVFSDTKSAICRVGKVCIWVE